MRKEIRNLVLSADNLTIGYSTPIAKNLNLTLEKGELVSVIGANGVGKSTLLKTLSGILPSLSGEIKIQGQAIQNFSLNDLAKKVSLVLTNAPRPGMLSGMEVIANGRYPYTSWTGKLNKGDYDQIDMAIRLTGVSDYVDNKVSKLSDGQMQKVMIARALAQDSELIILDEPSAYLDIGNRLAIMHLLRHLSFSTGKTILLSTHDLETAFDTSDQLWLMNSDNQIHCGAPEDLILNGAIANTFQSDKLFFDKTSGRFIRHQDFQQTVQVEGTGLFYNWTKRALNRIGIEVVPADIYGDLKVIVNEKDQSWQVHYYDKALVEEHTSVAAMIAAIRSKM